MSLEARRERLERATRRSTPPRGMRVAAVVERGVRGEWVSGPVSLEDRVILYVHGGAFCMGSPVSHRSLVGHICVHSQARAFSLDYRLAPEHPFPAAVEDTVAAYRYLLSLGLPPGRIAFAGDSAGGNLVLAALIALRDAGEALPAAAVCISPPTDLGGSSASLLTRAHMDPLLKLEAVLPLRRAYVDDERAADPLASPLRADLHGLPPLLIHVGSHEILYDDSVRFAAKAREAGVDARLEVGEELWHVWHAAVPYVPESLRAIRTIGRFVREHIPDESA